METPELSTAEENVLNLYKQDGGIELCDAALWITLAVIAFFNLGNLYTCAALIIFGTVTIPAMLLIATFALVLGIHKLRRFLNENPRLDQEVADERTV
jgi:hypothetical protein